MKKIKKLFIPEISEILVYLSISTAMLLALSYKNIWLLLGGSDLDQLKYSDMVSPELQNWIYKIDNDFIPRVADFIIWILVGLFVFLAFSLVKVFLESASDEKSVEEYINAPQKKSLAVYISRLLIRVVFSAMLIVWLFMFLFKVFPSLTKLFFTSIANISQPTSILWLLLSIILSAFGLYIFAVITRFVALKPRVFS